MYYNIRVYLYGGLYFRFAERVSQDMLSYWFAEAVDWLEEDHQRHPAQAIENYKIVVTCEA